MGNKKKEDYNIKEIGPYPAILKIGDDQRMVFCEEDEGPFYLDDNHREDRKYDKPKGEKKIVTKIKKELKNELKSKGHFVRGHCGREELEQMAEKNKIQLTNEVDLVEEGWLGKPKGLLQVLWERGWVDERKLSEYSLNGQKHQMDAEGKIKEEYHNFVLRTLMMNCADFKEE